MEKFNIQKRLKSFTYAWKGICTCFSQEHNVWIHLTITIGVVIAGFLFSITRMEWLLIVLCIGLVLMAETFNTAIERLVNLVSPQRHPIAGEVKDIAAGAVLISAIAAAIVGLSIFIPYFTELFR